MKHRRTISVRAGVIIAAIAVALTGLYLLRLRETGLRIAVHRGVEGVALKTIIKDFARLRNVSIEVIELSYEQLYAAEIEDVGRKNEKKFDVIMLDDPWMEALLEYDPQRNDQQRLRRIQIPCPRVDGFVASTLRVARYPYFEDTDPKCDDKFFALPFVGNSQLFLYKPSAYGGVAPEKWNAALESDYVMRVGAGNQIVTDFVPMIWEQSGGEDFRKGNFSLSNSLGAFGLLDRLGKKGKKNLSVISQDDFDLAIQLAQGNASAAIIWSAWAMAIARLPEPQLKKSFGEFRFAPMPGGRPVLGTWLLAVPANASNGDLAEKFVLYATEVEQIQIAANAGNPPPLGSVLQKLEQKETEAREKKKALVPPFDALFAEQLKSLKAAVPRPRAKHWNSIETAVGDCLSSLYESSIDAKTAMDRSSLAINAIESQPGWNPNGFSCADSATLP